MTNKPCRSELMNWIYAVSFAVDDVKLFLDTHPTDTKALEYFHEYSKLRNQALDEYAKYYGIDEVLNTYSNTSLNIQKDTK